MVVEYALPRFHKDQMPCEPVTVSEVLTPARDVLDIVLRRKRPSVRYVELRSPYPLFPTPDGSEYAEDPEKVLEFVFGGNFEAELHSRNLLFSVTSGQVQHEGDQLLWFKYAFESDPAESETLLQDAAWEVHVYLWNRRHQIQAAVQKKFDELKKNMPRWRQWFQ